MRAWRGTLLGVAVLSVVAVCADVTSVRADGQTWKVTTRAAAFRHPGVPTTAVHVPAGFDATAPLDLVVFLHGWSSCVAGIVDEGVTRCTANGSTLHGWGLTAIHDQANTNTLFIVPQLKLLKRDGNPGRFQTDGVFRAFLDELLSEHVGVKLGKRVTMKSVRTITLVAHSAGFLAAMAILRHGDVGPMVRNVILLDALYDAAPVFAEWARGSRDRKLVSLYTGNRTTYRHNQSLIHLLHDQGARDRSDEAKTNLTRTIRENRIVIARTGVGHGAIPSEQLDDILRALQFRARTVSDD